MKLQRLSPVLTIIENDNGECYSVLRESGYPITDMDIKDIIDEHWSWFEVKATFMLVPVKEPSRWSIIICMTYLEQQRLEKIKAEAKTEAERQAIDNLISYNNWVDEQRYQSMLVYQDAFISVLRPGILTN